jgi:UDP-N-acetylmuramate dehydrogenase
MKITLEKNKDISNFMTFHTKTTAKYYCEVFSQKDFQEAVKMANSLGVPLLILGGGSNLVITENILQALVVRNLYIKKQVLAESKDKVELLVSSGYPTNKLVMETVDHGLEGLEYHRGLPGTIGGAIYMNSKWTKPLRYIGDYLIKAVLMDNQGNLKEVGQDYFDFRYDFSRLQKTKEIIVEVVFSLKKADKKILAQRAEEALSYRLKTQPKGVSSCGCFFRNISEKDRQRLNLPTRSVGYLLDQLNLKGLTVGDFMVSDIHANFIINKGNQKSDKKDLKKLLEIIKNKVREKYQLELVEEVVLI